MKENKEVKEEMVKKNEDAAQKPEAYVARLAHTQLDVYQQDAICSCGGVVTAVGTRAENGTKAFVSRCNKCGCEYLLAYEFPRLVYRRRGDAPSDIALAAPTDETPHE